MHLPTLLVLAAASASTAQTVLDYSKLPACARSCAILDQAEKNCVPPAAPVTNQAIYQSCVCQSALLVPLHLAGSLCTQVCGADDVVKVNQYYGALCSGPVVQPPLQNDPQPAPAPNKPPSETTDAQATASASAAARPARKAEKEDWFSTHWKWVVMVMIIGLAIVFFWIGGIYLRRHYDRKHEAKRTNLAASDAPYNPRSNGVLTPTRPNLGPQMGMTGSSEKTRTLRTRSSTLQSIGIGNSSRNLVPQPVVWGPHQHLANSRVNSTVHLQASASNTDITPPHAIAFRNREGMHSEPRFAHYQATPSSINVEPHSYTPPRLNWTSTISSENTCPLSAIDEPVRDVARGRRTLLAVKSDPALYGAQEMSAEICEGSPVKERSRLQKLRGL